MSTSQLQIQLYQAFDVGPLTDTQGNLRVVLDDARKTQGIAGRLDRKIRLSKTGKGAHVIAGHRGSGKSTELYHLKSLLESGSESKFFTILCDTGSDIDRNDVDFLDVLLSILRHLAKELKDRQNIDLQPGYLRDRMNSLVKFLGSEVSVDKLPLSAGLGNFTLAIKNSPDARATLRKAFEPDAGNWVNAANAVIGDAISELHNKGFAGLVILVDDLDKIARVRHKDGDCWVAENLFVRRAAQLTDLTCHVVYAMPLELAYSHNEPAIKSSFGGDVPVLPMAKVMHRPPSTQPFEEGIDAFLNLIDRRVESVNAKRSDLFDCDKTACEIILLSGGQPTELMTLITEGLLWGTPISSSMVDKLRIKGQREYAMQLRQEYWDTIERVRKDGSILRGEKNDQSVVELLESRAILQYVNGDPWYRENPYITNITRPLP